jgi:hypothetical protein
VGLAEIAPALGLQLFVNRLGTAPDLQPTGQESLLRQASRDAVIHRLPDPVDHCVQRITVDHGLIGALHFRDALARGGAHARISFAVPKG